MQEPPIGNETPNGSPESRDLGNKVERFAKLLASVQRKLFLYILSLIHQPVDAEDILQETNLVLWRKFDEFDPQTDFLRWACKVAYYEVLKFRSRRSKSEGLLSEEVLEVLAHDAGELLGQAERRREALAYCLQKLREPLRRLVLARYAPDATIQSAAHAVGKTVEAARRALHRARMFLLECIRRRLAADSLG